MLVAAGCILQRRFSPHTYTESAAAAADNNNKAMMMLMVIMMMLMIIIVISIKTVIMMSHAVFCKKSVPRPYEASDALLEFRYDLAQPVTSVWSSWHGDDDERRASTRMGEGSA